MRTIWVVMLTLALSFVVVGCAGDSPTAPPVCEQTVVVGDSNFDPNIDNSFNNEGGE